MSLVDEVRAAPNPLEALMRIAVAVEQLQEAQAAVPTLDSWAGWVPEGQAPGGAPAPSSSAPESALTADRQAPPPAPGLTERDLPDDVVIAWMRKNYKGAAGLEPNTPDGKMAIAQVREDLLHAPNVKVVEDLFRQTTEGIIESDLDWSPLTDKHRAARYDFAKRVLNLDVALGDHPTGGDWAADYASGGPMWFYIPNRDLVMQYPEHVRGQMVEDVRVTSHARVSQQAADKLTHEFGADVLKKPMSTDREGGAPIPPIREEDL